MSPHRLKAYTYLLITAVIWGIAGPVIKFTLGGLDPTLFLVYRFGVASLAAIVVFLIYGIKLHRVNLVELGIYAFLTSTVGLGLLFLGYDETTAIDASLISATAPFFVAIAGALFLKEHFTRREQIGTVIAFAGTAITILEPVLKNGHGFSSIRGNLLILASVIVGVITSIMAKKIMRTNISATTVTNASFMVGFATSLPLAIKQYGLEGTIATIASTGIEFHLGVIYMAILSGTLAYTLWHKAEKMIEVGEVGLIAYTYPIFSTPIAVIWLGEKITLPFIVGAVVIATGVLIAELKPKK